MAGFCNQCGRPLADGEVCHCTDANKVQPNATVAQESTSQYQQAQQDNQQYNGQQYQQYGGPQYQQNGQQFQQQAQQVFQTGMATTKNVFLRIFTMLKSPLEEVKSAYQANDGTFGISMIVSNIVVTFIMMIITCLVLKAKMGSLGGFVDIPYAKIIFGSTFAVAIIYFAQAGLLMAFSKLIGKAQETFGQFCLFVGVGAVYNMLLLVVTVILALVAPEVAIIICLLAAPVGMFMTLVAYCDNTQIKSSSKAYVLWVTQICLIIVFYLLFRMGLNSAIEGIGNQIGGLGRILGGM